MHPHSNALNFSLSWRLANKHPFVPDTKTSISSHPINCQKSLNFSSNLPKDLETTQRHKMENKHFESMNKFVKKLLKIYTPLRLG